MNEDRLSEEMQAVERALVSLKPAPSRVDRDALMFRAGQASARHRDRLWPLTSLAMALLAVTFGALLVMRPAPEPTERIVYVTQAVPQPEPVKRSFEGAAARDWAAAAAPEARRPLGEWSYGRLRDKVLAEGVDALPVFMTAGEARERESLEDMLGPLCPPDSKRPGLPRLHRLPMNWGGES